MLYHFYRVCVCVCVTQDVVSGATTPDTAVVDRVVGGGDRLELVSITPGKLGRPLCLDTEAVLHLAKVGIEIEQIMGGSAQDIEFILAKDRRIYVVQSRDITTFGADTESQLCHEFDTALPSAHELITTANVGLVIFLKLLYLLLYLLFCFDLIGFSYREVMSRAISPYGNSINCFDKVIYVSSNMTLDEC